MEKDITEKQLERFPDVAADIINGICFGGKQAIRPEEIQVASEQVAIRESGGYRSRVRDVLYQIERLGVCVAYIGLENQSGMDSTMPLRVMGMDYGKYAEQIRQRREERGGFPAGEKLRRTRKLLPVITLVLNYGKPWKGPRRLRDMLDLQEMQALSEYVADYPINLIDLSEDPKLCQRFRSDFRIVVQYLQARGDEEKMQIFRKNEQGIKHPVELLDTLYALGYDSRYLEMKGKAAAGKEEITMCEVLDYFENRGLEKGREEGLAEGRTEGTARGIVVTAAALGVSREKARELICRELQISPARAETYLERYAQ